MRFNKLRSRWVCVALAATLAFAALPAPSARAESSTLDPNLTIGLLVVVVGVFGWVAWTMDKEDKSDPMMGRALLPLYRAEDDSAALGVLLSPSVTESDELAFATGLAIGRRF
ncbi:MAG: hypothetical protein H3C50_09385 [Kiritimatiellae bacterium]|nr:hypothetical protein [Kiritimatiellia bacterium]MCO5067507.1 hypothetical protein [Kiritimatiellia bacterium]